MFLLSIIVLLKSNPSHSGAYDKSKEITENHRLLWRIDWEKVSSLREASSEKESDLKASHPHGSKGLETASIGSREEAFGERHTYIYMAL